MFQVEEVTEQLLEWITVYFEENATADTKAVIGISGGKDSSVAAALCKEALGKERVLGVLLPQGKQEDIEISYELCRFLDIPHIEINIANAVQALYEEITKTGARLNDIARFNTPARIRMTTLYAVSGMVGGRVVNTGNLSENWIGYATKFGDAAGDFAPLANLTVTEVKAVGRKIGLLPKFVDKVPIDGLCGQTDEENLGFTYAALDRYLRENICEDVATKKKIDELNRKNLHKIQPMPQFFLTNADVDSMIK